MMNHFVSDEHVSTIRVSNEAVWSTDVDEGSLHPQNLLDGDGGVVIGVKQELGFCAGMHMTDRGSVFARMGKRLSRGRPSSSPVQLYQVVRSGDAYRRSEVRGVVIPSA